MNSLILLPDECKDGTAIVKGARALYLRETHEVKVGIECRASIYGGKRGRARIVCVSKDEVRLDYVMNEEPLERTRCIVIVAIPRPQTVKKILQISSTMGVEELHFIQTENTEKSYLKSKALNEEEMRDEIIKGLEQSFDSLPPLVSIHPKYWQFKKHVLTGLLSRWAKKRAFLLATKGASRFHLG
ncbi:MAG: hypothetical protein GYA55_05135, partial [SAR324 cluster bacterium]|nr:hypothetical protein [SAR324 cluster bacterium]